MQNPDVLAELGAARRPGQVLVGFAAETGDADGTVLDHGRAKLARKGCDLLVVNEVGEAGHPTGFEGDDNAGVVLGADGTQTPRPARQQGGPRRHGVGPRPPSERARLPAR